MRASPSHHLRPRCLLGLVQTGMRYQGAAPVGDDELEHMRSYQDNDPRAEFMSAFPVSAKAAAGTDTSSVRGDSLCINLSDGDYQDIARKRITFFSGNAYPVLISAKRNTKVVGRGNCKQPDCW